MRLALLALVCAASPAFAALDDEALPPPAKPPPSHAHCTPLIDIIAATLNDDVDYEPLPFALVGDLNAIYNALPPKSTDAFDGAVAGSTHERTIILLTRGSDVCATLPPLPAAAWHELHRRIFGIMS